MHFIVIKKPIDVYLFPVLTEHMFHVLLKKHRWRVGIMTEMAPVGYVGVSPKCLLGFNKVRVIIVHSYMLRRFFCFNILIICFDFCLLLQNQGEEISLRLRTDDLKGFRKYESIKKTLLHELVRCFLQPILSVSWLFRRAQVS